MTRESGPRSCPTQASAPPTQGKDNDVDTSDFRQSRSSRQGMRSRWTRTDLAVILSAVAATVAGAVGLASVAQADTWLGGVHYTYHFDNGDSAWSRFNSGPDATGYDAMLGDCTAMGGTVIVKAGSGSVTDLRDGRWQVVFDYSCWKGGSAQGKLAAAQSFQQLVQSGVNSGAITGGMVNQLSDLADNLIVEINNGSDVTSIVADGRRIVGDGASKGQITQGHSSQLDAALAAVLTA